MSLGSINHKSFLLGCESRFSEECFIRHKFCYIWCLGNELPDPGKEKDGISALQMLELSVDHSVQY